MQLHGEEHSPEQALLGQTMCKHPALSPALSSSASSCSSLGSPQDRHRTRLLRPWLGTAIEACGVSKAQKRVSTAVGDREASLCMSRQITIFNTKDRLSGRFEHQTLVKRRVIAGCLSVRSAQQTVGCCRAEDQAARGQAGHRRVAC